MKTSLFETRIWKLATSLKLAIVLACAATVAVIGGSLLIPFNPRIFASMDQMPLGEWMTAMWSQAPTLVWWVPVASLLIFLLGLNTLFCFLDWVFSFRARWRKTGEYLIHLGFVLVLAAYIWGSLSGFRSENNRIFIGQTVPLPLSGVYLRLEGFEPVYNTQGRPVDMVNHLVLLERGREVARARARINHPLTWRGLVVLPASFGQTPLPGRRGGVATYSILTINRDPGAALALAGGVSMGVGALLAMVSFYRKRSRGERPEVV